VNAHGVVPAPKNGPDAAQSWTILSLVLWSADYLASKGVESGRLDAEWLLASALGTERLQLYLKYDRPVGPEEREVFKQQLRRRACREPLQYILGRAAFRELELVADPRALIPRPETEVLVEEVLAWAKDRKSGLGTVMDIGTGTGAVSVSLAVEGVCEQIVATDISEGALEVARLNAQRHGVEALLDFRRGSLFEIVDAGEAFDVIVSNPPYVATGERAGLQPEIRDWEPSEALFAGDEGLDVIQPLIAEAPEHLTDGGLLALEVGLGQAERVTRQIDDSGRFEPARVRRDLGGLPRVIMAERKTRATPQERAR
jgi:release factor glutamine methyltransferase